MAPTRKKSTALSHKHKTPASSMSTMVTRSSSGSSDSDESLNTFDFFTEPQTKNWENKVLRCLSKVKNYLDPLGLGKPIKSRTPKRNVEEKRSKDETDESRKRKLEKYIMKALQGVEGPAKGLLSSSKKTNDAHSKSQFTDDTTKDRTDSNGTSIANLNIGIPPESIDSTDRYLMRMQKNSVLFNGPRSKVTKPTKSTKSTKSTKRLQKPKFKKDSISPTAVRQAIQNRIEMASASDKLEKRDQRPGKKVDPTPSKVSKKTKQKEQNTKSKPEH